MRFVDLGTTHINSAPKKEKPAKGKKQWIGCCGCFVIVLILIFALFKTASSSLGSIFDPVSFVFSKITQNPLKETDGRTNFLILGVDTRGSDTSGLTDTIIVISIDREGKNPVMLSLPRDLWVESPKGVKSKLNKVYPISGREEAQRTIDQVIGMPIHYYTIVNFKVFTEVVKTLGGLDIDVETAFEDFSYPIAGRENAEPESSRYETLKFSAGPQNMDADTALKFARSRKGTNGEGTDFARAKRQQKVIVAVLEKAISIDILSNPAKLKDLFDSYKKNIDTDVGFAESQKLLEIAKSIQSKTIKSYVIDDRSDATEGGLLYEPEDKTLYRGSYVLIPRSGDYTQIHSFVQRIMFGD